MKSLSFPRWLPKFLLLTLALSGCAMRGGSIPYSPAGFTAPDPVAPATVAADYKLSPGDVVNVHVYELDTLSGDQTVDTAGQLNMPLIGQVAADGLTTQQLSDRLASLLGAKYLQSPHVTVALKSAVQRTLTVDGAVQKPGVYAIGSDSTLIQAIALASGTSTDANPKRVVIFRQINGQREAASFDLTTIRKGTDQDPRVYPRDTIVVDGSNISSGYRTLLKSLPLAAFFLRF